MIRKYRLYMNCVIQDGILKAAFYLPDYLRLDGDKPAYEVFLDKENRQFLTYDHLEKKWRDAKLDRLEWPGDAYYTTCWAGKEDEDLVQAYFSGERGGASAFSIFNGMCGMSSWIGTTNGLPTVGPGSGAGSGIAERLEALGRQGGRAGKFYIYRLQ